MLFYYLKPNMLLELIHIRHFMHFLNEISHILAVGEIDQTGSFLEKVRVGETVVGTCKKDIMILLTYRNQLQEKKNDWEAALESTDPEKEKQTYIEYLGKSWFLNQKIETLSAYINVELHIDFPELLVRDVIHIRQGWQIVWSTEKRAPNILPVLLGAIKSLSTPRPTSLAGKN